jgi:hypothetical protein
MENSTTRVGKTIETVSTDVNLTCGGIVNVNTTALGTGNPNITPTESVENLWGIGGDLY